MILDMGQWLSVPFILLGAAFMYYSFAKKTYPKAVRAGKK
jgi:prolipoprotein diacylglyceryltransferase